jgi:hypothetical protein
VRAITFKPIDMSQTGEKNGGRIPGDTARVRLNSRWLAGGIRLVRQPGNPDSRRQTEHRAKEGHCEYAIESRSLRSDRRGSWAGHDRMQLDP